LITENQLISAYIMNALYFQDSNFFFLSQTKNTHN